MKLNDGTYEVLSILDCGLFEKDSVVKPYLKIQVKTEHGPADITWYGRLAGKTQESTEKIVAFTVKTLLTCGFVGTDFADLAKPGAASIYFVLPQHLTVLLETENNYQNIKYFNRGSVKKDFKGTAPKFANIFAEQKAKMGLEEIPF